MSKVKLLRVQISCLDPVLIAIWKRETQIRVGFRSEDFSFDENNNFTPFVGWDTWNNLLYSLRPLEVLIIPKSGLTVRVRSL